MILRVKHVDCDFARLFHTRSCCYKGWSSVGRTGEKDARNKNNINNP